jgi:hypothetical protein
MHRQSISIWFFIGTLLVIYGLLILGSGIYEISHPPEQTVVLANLHAAIWWGGFMLVLGIVYMRSYAPGRRR